MQWILIGLGIGMVAYLATIHRRRIAARLPTMTSREFLVLMRRRLPGLGAEDQQILDERGRIAAELGVPPAVLHPDLHLDELVSKLDVLLDVRVGLGNLYSEAEALADESGFEIGQEGMSTVGAYISVVLRARGERRG